MIFVPGDAVCLRISYGPHFITRWYTPVRCENVGKIDLIIKCYTEGRFTSLLEKIPLSTLMYMRGPSNETPELFNSETSDGIIKLLTADC